MGFDVSFGRARSAGEHGVYDVLIAYKEEEPASAAFEVALRLVLAAMHNQPFDVAAQEIGLPVVVKPESGNQGKGVSVNLVTEAEVRAAYRISREFRGDVLVERYVEGDDYRLLVVNGTMVAAARRDPASVMGDARPADASGADERSGARCRRANRRYAVSRRAPSRFPIIAVTGTNGKTTVTRLIAHMYETARMTVGRTSTEGRFIGGEKILDGDRSGSQVRDGHSGSRRSASRVLDVSAGHRFTLGHGDHV